MKIRVLLSLTFLAVFLVANNEIVSINVSSTSPIFDQDTVSAREQALKLAWDMAVQEAFGVVVNSETLMENEIIINSYINTQSNARIYSSKILVESYSEDHIKLEVKVELSQESSDLIDQDIWKQDKIMILSNNDDLKSKLTELMIDHGYQVIELKYDLKEYNDLEHLINESFIKDFINSEEIGSLLWIESRIESISGDCSLLISSGKIKVIEIHDQSTIDEIKWSDIKSKHEFQSLAYNKLIHEISKEVFPSVTEILNTYFKHHENYIKIYIRDIKTEKDFRILLERIAQQYSVNRIINSEYQQTSSTIFISYKGTLASLARSLTTNNNLKSVSYGSGQCEFAFVTKNEIDSSDQLPDNKYDKILKIFLSLIFIMFLMIMIIRYVRK